MAIRRPGQLASEWHVNLPLACSEDELLADVDRLLESPKAERPRDRARILLKKFDMLRLSGRKREARSVLKEAYLLAPDDPDIYATHFLALRAEERIPAAEVDRFMEAARKSEDSARMQFVRAGVYLNTHRYEDALASATLALAADPEFLDGWYARALAHVAMAQIEEAVADLQEFVKRRATWNRERHHKACGMLGGLLVHLGRHEEGVEHLSVCQHSEYADPDYDHAMWVGLVNVGRVASAAALAEKSLRERPDSQAAALEVILHRADVGDLEAALADAEKLAVKAPATASKWLVVGRLKEASGDRNGARAAFDRGLKIPSAGRIDCIFRLELLRATSSPAGGDEAAVDSFSEKRSTIESMAAMSPDGALALAIIGLREEDGGKGVAALKAISNDKARPEHIRTAAEKILGLHSEGSRFDLSRVEHRSIWVPPILKTLAGPF